MFDATKYKSEYNSQNYSNLKIRIPKEKKPIVDELVETTGKSINRIFIEAVEKTHKVNLTNSEDETFQTVDKMALTLKELGRQGEAVLIKKFYKAKKDEALSQQELLEQIEQRYSELLWGVPRGYTEVKDEDGDEVEFIAPQKSEGHLAHNAKNNRYGLLVGNHWVCRGFRCGDAIEVRQDGQWIPTRVEYDGDWYLDGTAYRGDLEGIKARI